MSRAGLMRHQELIQILSGSPVKLSLHKLEDIPPNSGDFRSALKDVRNSGEYHFILDCDFHVVCDILHQVCVLQILHPSAHHHRIYECEGPEVLALTSFSFIFRYFAVPFCGLKLLFRMWGSKFMGIPVRINSLNAPEYGPRARHS